MVRRNFNAVRHTHPGISAPGHPCVHPTILGDARLLVEMSSRPRPLFFLQGREDFFQKQRASLRGAGRAGHAIPCGPELQRGNPTKKIIMATLIILTFNNTDGTRPLIEAVEERQTLEMMTLADAATVVWPVGMPEPTTRCLRHLGGAGRFSAPFWPLFFGVALHFPWQHPRADVPSVFAQFGISNDFLRKFSARTIEGSSSLVLFSEEEIAPAMTALAAELELTCEILTSEIPPENAERLRRVFGLPTVRRPIFESVSLELEAN